MTSSPDPALSAWKPFSFPVQEVVTPEPPPVSDRPAASHGETATTGRSSSDAAISSWVFPEMDAPPAPPPPEIDPVREAYNQGFTEGVHEGFAQKSDEVRSALDALLNSVSELQREREEQSRLLSHYVHALSVAVAQKIVQREVTTEPGIVKDLVVRGLELIPVNEPIEVHMNPLDLEALRPQLDAVAEQEKMPAIQWQVDPAMGRGSFIIESPQRVVSGKVDVALRALYERLEYE